MAPSAIHDVPMASGRNSPRAAPTKLYSVSEPPFEGYRPVDTEGYARSNHETAIVIDNGSCHQLQDTHRMANMAQARQLSAQAGLSMRSPGYRCCPTWRDTGTGNSTAPSPSSARMSTRTAPRAASRSPCTSRAATSSTTGTPWKACWTTASSSWASTAARGASTARLS
jgi:hypothetical protein